MGTGYTYKKNPNFGQPGEPEMLAAETFEHDDPLTFPAVLSKTAFQDLSFASLGGGVAGMARFQAIMDACEAGTTNGTIPAGAVKACFSRYEAATTFAKDQVASFTQLMQTAGIMTSDERNAVLNAWPNS